jgi:serine protease inhibitor
MKRLLKKSADSSGNYSLIGTTEGIAGGGTNYVYGERNGNSIIITYTNDQGVYYNYIEDYQEYTDGQKVTYDNFNEFHDKIKGINNWTEEGYVSAIVTVTNDLQYL